MNLWFWTECKLTPVSDAMVHKPGPAPAPHWARYKIIYFAIYWETLGTAVTDLLCCLITTPIESSWSTGTGR